ncbi:MAG: bifunctional 1-(5-phosphoribosyl)-5-((5-phosphoribosylamino)methylideneamino)imidazole-4-carboxamide isomerase/phosphoribosylanthranilate isomerase PriA [Pseudoclavibacter sp.]|nr:bifunctional 1-(5-phosphoribosyl)-5-((5-phosphoribosylamino)methylideneamino)imidazole-4-carboxamide isomerase/phosphoribosylanthranilate isomerase PriA [Pseudoclavibacter sp.]
MSTTRTPAAPGKLTLFPAVDVQDGRAVRLVQGEADSATAYGDPVEAAAEWAEQGAEWIHLVDLDAAFGRGDNREVIARVIRELQGRLRIELSGGIRDDASLERAAEAGVARVNLGTAALEDPAWTERVIERHGELVAIGLDVRGTTLAARGWTREGGELFEVLERLEACGAARYVVTDVTKDGTLRGPNTELLRRVMARTERPVIASGGVATLRDVAALRELVPLGLEGAIIGKALYSGAFTLREALRTAS